MQGYIAIHRKILNWEWFKEPNHFHVFSYLLLMAQHKDTNYKGIFIPKGSLLTSIKSICDGTGLKTQVVRTILKRLNLTKELTIKSTSKWTIISIVHWSDYQRNNKVSNKQLTNGQQTTNKQLTTFNNDNNVNNENNEREEKNSPSDSIYQITLEVLQHLNELTGSKFSEQKNEYQILVSELLREEYTKQDMLRVIKNKVDEWFELDHMKKHLRPETLLGKYFKKYHEEKTNSENYQSTIDQMLKDYDEYGNLKIVGGCDD